MKKRKLDYKLQDRSKKRPRKKLRRNSPSKKPWILILSLLLFVSLFLYFLSTFFLSRVDKDFQHFLWIHVQEVQKETQKTKADTENPEKLDSVILISYLEEANLLFFSFLQGEDSIDGLQNLQQSYQKGMEKFLENFAFLSTKPYYQVVSTQFYSLAFGTPKVQLKAYLEEPSRIEPSLEGVLDTSSLSNISKNETSFLYPVQKIDKYLFSETLTHEVQKNRLIVSLLALLHQRKQLLENKKRLKNLNSSLLSHNLSPSKARKIQVFLQEKNLPKTFFFPFQNPEKLKTFLNQIQNIWEKKKIFTAEDYLSSLSNFFPKNSEFQFSTRWIDRSGRRINSISLARFLKLFYLDIGSVLIEEKKPPLENSQLIALKKNLHMALYLKEALQTHELYWSAETKQNTNNWIDFILVGGKDFPKFD